MAFEVRIVDELMLPAAGCDHCGSEATAEGFVLWRVSPQPSTVLVACSDDCLAALTGETNGEPGTGDWAAVQLDAYLAGLVSRLGIDLAVVAERERAAAATEQTRQEGPE